MVGKFDGICGMGWDDISVDHVKTPVRALVDSKKLDSNVFAFHLGTGGAAGELTLGGVNPAQGWYLFLGGPEYLFLWGPPKN